MSQPLVSIGLPVFNGERFLEAAIRSNLGQTYANIELIICDNASTDGTEAICRDFAQADPRVTYHRHARNIGAAANYNRLFQLARGEFFRWSNADDVAAPTLIEQTLPVLASRPDVVIAYGRTCLIDEQGLLLEEYDDHLHLPQDRASDRYIAFHESVGLTNIIYGIMRASAMRRTSLMGQGKFPHADIHFMATMSLQGKFIGLPEVLFYRRMHRAALSSSPQLQEDQSFWNASSARFLLPHWRRAAADIGAIISSPAPPTEKARLLSYSARQLVWGRRELAHDLVRLFPPVSRGR